MVQGKLQLGDSVIVKPNVEELDLNINIGGWQGRVAEIEEEDGLIGIDWDSLTLKQIPDKTIVYCEVEGLDWARAYLEPADVEQTTARDTEDDVVKAIEDIESKHDFTWTDEDPEESEEIDRRIQAVLDNAEDESEEAAFEVWQEYLEDELEFPFEAEIFECQEEGPLQEGDQVTVVDIYEDDDEEYDVFDDDIEDIYGILVSLRHGREKYEFPLCDLEVLDKSSSNYQPVKDYAIWLANR
ncbi:MAG: calcium-binding protein [Candidatus Electrothrix scaldis]|nr:MAG: calcium-binding protein [Candidatus Electrothrix sp. GW3-3]